MKGLLIKDLYTLTRQMKAFLVLIVVFACLPGSSMSGFAVVYAGMLPMTALAYDERSKWDALAATMPYSANSLVLSKYVLGYLVSFCTAALCVAAQLVVSVVKGEPVSAELLWTPAVMFLVATVIQAVNLPFMYRFGVEKGRLVFLALIALSVAGGMVLSGSLGRLRDAARLDVPALGAAAVLGVLAVNLVSVFLSVRAYGRRR